VINNNDLSILDRFTFYSRLLRVVVYCFRFLPNRKNVGGLIAEKIVKGNTSLKLLQGSRFAEEIKKLKNKIPINKGTLVNLNPFLENDLVRVGERLQNSQLSFGQKHPVLSNRHSLTDRIIREIHEKHHHTGIQVTLYILRQKF